MVRQNEQVQLVLERLEIRNLLSAVPFLPQDDISASAVASPINVQVHDWDRDGRPDLIFESTGNSIQLRRQVESGRFEKELEFADETSPSVADFDGDGKFDLLSYDGRSVQLRFSVADAPGVEPMSAFTHSRARSLDELQPIDVDADGDLDIAFQMNGFEGVRYGGLIFVENLGDRTFAEPQALISFDGIVWSDPLFLPGDFDGDGDTDVAAYIYESRRDLRLSWHENVGGDFVEHFIERGFRMHNLPTLRTDSGLPGATGEGLVVGSVDENESFVDVYSFDTNAGELIHRADLSLDDDVQNVFYADLTGDGQIDQVLKKHESYEWFQGLNGRLVPRGTIVDGPNRRSSINISDVNGDGNDDVVLSNGEFDQLAVYDFSPNGSFDSNIISSNSLSEIEFVLSVDLNRDNIDDLLVGGESVDWLPGIGPGQFGEATQIFNEEPRDIVAEDFDVDGDIDLVISFVDETIHFVNDGNGRFVEIEIGGSNTHLAVVDVDHDGDFDVVSDGPRSYTNPAISYYEFDNGNFLGRRHLISVGSIDDLNENDNSVENYIVIADLQAARVGDDVSAIIVSIDETAFGAGVVAVPLSGGDIGDPTTLSWGQVSNHWMNVLIADVNQDSKDDVVVNSNKHRKRAEWFDFQNGEMVGHMIDGCNCAFDAVADLDRDGDLDLIGADSTWRENVDGEIVRRRRWSKEENDWDLVLAVDLNGDGYSDILTAKDGNIAWNQNSSRQYDFNDDSTFGVADIDLLSAAIQGGFDSKFDVDEDQDVDGADLTTLLTDRIFTSPADVNLDGQFDSSDLVTLFQAGTYDKDVDAAWSEGDLNGDGRFDSADLIVAFASGDFIKE